MASKVVVEFVSVMNENNANGVLMALGLECIKQAYSDNVEDAQYAIDNLKQCWRVPFINWLKSVGRMDIHNPAVGSSRYTVMGVKLAKFQHKAITEAKVTDVLKAEHKVKEAKKAKVLEGSPEDRAAKAIASLVKRTRVEDEEAAAYLNNRWATNNDEVSAADLPMCINTGESFVELATYELRMVLDYLNAHRASLVQKAA